ncbi:MAG: FtsX-like permease family protein [Acidimicrobiia bacterium]|nr:FtsX-like permease family protein [Acidimicrobiia bacterium]
MVTWLDRVRPSALNRKLWRDVWEMKGQALAIASVIAAGVTMYVTYLSNFDSLQRTRADYYERQRFADVFASLTRAPHSLAARIADIEGVETVSTRVVADVTLDVPGIAEPAGGRLVAIPERAQPVLNGLYLRSGRWIDPTRPDEVLASEMFAEANGFRAGDRVAAISNGRKRWLTVVGIALSPEYIFAVKPGEIVPDRKRYGIFWMGQHALASAFDMEGGFNDVSVSISRNASEAEIIAAVDRLIEPYGGLGAIPRRLQISAWTLENELTQLQTFGFILPAIFLGVAVFILNVALTRALALQRQQIAALKALGYANAELAWHYLKWAVVIAAGGAVAGVLAGAQFGAGMTQLYNQYFRFPALDYRLSLDVAVQSVVGSVIVAALGAQTAVRRAVSVPPAEAMRPEPPGQYRSSIIERPWRRSRLSHATRMVLRNIERQPMRSVLSVAGIALAVAVLVVGFSFITVMEDLVDQQFTKTMRQDATVSFVRPRSPGALHAVQHLLGVMDVEPFRIVPVRARVGHRNRTLAITAVGPNPHLNRIMDRQGHLVPLPESGLVISRMLGQVLGARVGDIVQLEVLEGHRPTADVRVQALIDDVLGLRAYMQLDAVRRLLREGATLSGAHMTVGPAARQRFYAEVKAMPAVAGVGLREIMLQNFRETMAESMNLQVFLNVFFAGIIAFGVVYNSARVSLSERTRELASLRVRGFTRAEISLILLGELAILTLLALPSGAIIGYTLGQLIMLAFNNEIYRITFTLTASTVAWAFLTVIASAFLSGLVVRRRLDTLDLVAVLKTRE